MGYTSNVALSLTALGLLALPVHAAGGAGSFYCFAAS